MGKQYIYISFAYYFTDNVTIVKNAGKKLKYKKVEIIDCTTAKLSHKCSDSCKREKHIIDLSNQKYDTIDKTSNVMKCK